MRFECLPYVLDGIANLVNCVKSIDRSVFLFEIEVVGVLGLEVSEYGDSVEIIAVVTSGNINWFVRVNPSVPLLGIKVISIAYSHSPDAIFIWINLEPNVLCLFEGTLLHSSLTHGEVRIPISCVSIA